MNCLKCGRKISDEEVFCIECQLDAQQYPIDPGAAVYLPRRVTADAVKKPQRRRSVPLEEQVKVLRKRTRTLVIALVAAVVLVLALLYPSVVYFMEDHYRPGQNYTPMTTAPASTTSPTDAAR